MPPRMYQLTIRRGTQELSGLEPFLAAVDFHDEIERVRDVLNRHIYAAAERVSMPRTEAHLLVLEAREVTREGRPEGDVVFRWALPVEEDR